MTNAAFHPLLIVAVAAICTLFTRALPFALFGGKRELPPLVRYLGNVLPSAIIAILVVYCLKSLVPVRPPNGWAELCSIVMVAALHRWKHNTLLSIGGGTLLYMILIRLF